MTTANAPYPLATIVNMAATPSTNAGALLLQAPDAERLMRSRYSAYTLGPGRLPRWPPGMRARARPRWLDPPGLKWLGLEVRRHAQRNALMSAANGLV